MQPVAHLMEQGHGIVEGQQAGLAFAEIGVVDDDGQDFLLAFGGAQPVLVTPLCRRRFDHGELEDTLGPWAEAVQKVAAQEKVPVIDLHGYCLSQIRTMTQDEAQTYGPVSNAGAEEKGRPDFTHLGPKGAQFFSAYMAEQLRTLAPDL